MKRFKLAILAVIFSGNVISQCISEFGIWNNNANFIIEYYQDKVITSTTSGIQFIDVSSPSSPTPTASLGNPASFPMAIEVDGNYAYFGGGMNPYFMIADISNINFPTQVGITTNLSGTAYDIALSGNYAFMPTSSSILYAIDITNKTTPSVVSSINLGSFSQGIAIQGNYAFVGTNAGLQVIDISDPLNMTIVTTFGGGYAQIAADLANNRLFVSKTASGFDAIDISDPTNPVGLFQGIGGNTLGKLVYKNNYVFQIGTNAVSAFHITQNSSTYLCSYNSTLNGQINSVAVKDSVFYVTTVNDFHVLNLNGAIIGLNHLDNTSKLIAYPNPAKESIYLEVQDNKTYLIEIVDTKGKAQYSDQIMYGKLEINTSNLESGIYFIRSYSDGNLMITKFVKQ
ncbi:T9SS type A sorting domain-containing protein [Brumimicrobium aurantiacum]|nr:T9SS type A sorting domain-containing protein [Brumimicrobium aurantiacum]MCO5260719.1 T9SS type A sorting domain-containing protein [Crocinitomicaceae bacterium]